MVTAKILIEGVWFAMEQAGRLLTSAVRLYKADDFGSAIALAMFAHEELGRSRILLDFANEVDAGSEIEAQGLRKRCSDHLEKQRRGALSVTIRIDPRDPYTDTLGFENVTRPGSPEYAAARAAIDERVESIAATQPSERHSQRMSAVYVDLASDGSTWKRPAEIGRQVAFERLSDAVNDYSVGRQWFDEPLLNTSDQALLANFPKFRLLRIGKPSCVVLPPPTWPDMPV